MKFSYDGFGINDKEDEYASRIATFSNRYKGRDDIGKLLAAAPELLEALRSFAYDYAPRPQDLSKYREQARAAIAKAKGDA